jgi:AAA+ superfamily predicted ATPase
MIDQFRGRGFLIAATNLEESLDPAIWRRFDEVLLFDMPQDREVKKMLTIKTRNFPMEFSLDSKIPKLRGFSYADIERVCLMAIKKSILRKSRTIRESEFDIAIREERQRQAVRFRLKSTTP